MNTGMKTKLTLFFFLSTLLCSAQKLDWGATVKSKSSTDVFFTSLHGDQIVWGSPEFAGEVHGRKLKDGMAQLSWGPSSSVLSFSTDGSLLWQQSLMGSILLGMDHKPNGDLAVLVDIEYYDEDADDKPIGIVPAVYGDVYVPAGPTLLIFDAKGKLLNNVHCPYINTEQTEVFNFATTPNGGYVIAGAADPGQLTSALKDVFCGPAGGDFIMGLDAEGIPQWADAISFNGESCCSRFSIATQLEVDAQGNSFFAGSYQVGATFGGEQAVLAPVTIEEQQKKQEGYETYVAAYASDGTFNWVRTSGCKGLVGGLAVDDKQVYLGYGYTGSTSFGKNVEVAEGRNSAVVAFNKKGKVKWHFLAKGTLNAMAFDPNGSVIVGGEVSNIKKEPEEMYPNVFVARTDHMLTTAISVKGKLVYAKTNRLLISTSNTGLNMEVDAAGNVFYSGLIWCTLNLNLTMLDSILPEDDCGGGTQFLIRIK